MKNSNFLFLAASLCLFSCSTYDEIQPEYHKEYDSYGFSSIEEAREQIGVYANIFAKTKGSMFIRYTGFGNELINKQNAEQTEISARYWDELEKDRKNGGIFTFDDLTLSFSNATKQYELETGPVKINQISNLFGKTNQISLTRDYREKISFKHYAPQKIVVDIPLASGFRDSNMQFLKRDDFEFIWNMDRDNENGVLVYLWWDGDKVGLPNHLKNPEDIVQRAIVLDDKGSGTISKDFFNDIPYGAIVSLFFIRANIDIKYLEEESFKFYSVAQYKINIALNN